MAHIVCLTRGLTGLLYSSFELLRRLDEAGHRITYASLKDVSGPVTAQGYDFMHLGATRASPSVHQSRETRTPSPAASRSQRLLTRQARRQQAVDVLGSSQFVDIVRDLTPDLLLIDCELHPYIIAAVPLGIPTVLLSPFFSLWKRPAVPPLHLDIIPGRGWRGRRLGIEWAWLSFRLRKVRSRLRDWLRHRGADTISILRHHARQTGFPFRKEVALYQWPIPFTYRTLPVLCLNALELDFPHDPHPSVQYVGPMIHLERKDTRSDQAVKATLMRLVERCQASTQRSLILCSFSTFTRTDSAFVHRLVRAAERRTNWEFVLSLGGRATVDELGRLPSNVHVFSWLPLLELLGHADCVITNAGINTINECIHFGVPMVIYSLKMNDQNGTAARVAYHRIGIVGDMDRDDADTILQHIDRVLADPHLKRNIEQMRHHFHTYVRENRAVEIIEQLLGSAS